MPDVSVVLTTFNSAATLARAIDSVLSQSFENLELIVCDDASQDLTQVILERYEDARLRIIKNEKNLRQGPSRDKAISLAQGRWIAFIDADDVWHPKRLEKMIDATVDHGNVIVFDDLMQCYDTDGRLVPWRSFFGPFIFGANEGKPMVVSCADFLSAPRTLIKPLIPAQIIRDNAIQHSEKQFEDLEFLLKVFRVLPKLIYVPEPLYFYRIAHGNMWRHRERHARLYRVLREAVEAGGFAGDVQMALERRLAVSQRWVDYAPFVWALKDRHFGEALRMSVSNPWLLAEFARKIPGTLRYHISRRLHGEEGW